MNNEKESPRNSAEFSGADKILQDENTDIIKKIKTDIEWFFLITFIATFVMLTNWV